MGKVRAQRISYLALLLFSFFLQGAYPQDFSKEIDKYKKEIRNNPNHVESIVQLARYLSWSGRFEESIEQYKQALKLQPSNVEAEIGLATVYSWQKKFPEAIRIYKKILEKYPDNQDALVGLGRVYSWQGSHSESIKVLQQTLNLDPDNREALLSLGRVYSWDKKYKESEAIYTKLLAKNPKDIEVLKGLANTYKWGEQYTKGIATELKILEFQPKDVDSQLSIGYMYGQLGAIKQSIHWYEKAAKLAPERGDIQAHLGLLYSHTAQVDSAANAFKKAITLQERDIENYIALGRVYSWQNKMEESEKILKKALEVNPQSAGAWAGLGQLYYFNGVWDKSIYHYKRSLEIDPGYVESIQGLKRVNLLKAPTFTSRYNHFINESRDALTHELLTQELVDVFSNEGMYKFALGKAIELRFQQARYDRRDKNAVLRDYWYYERIASVRLDYPLWKDHLFFSGRYDQELFGSRPEFYEFQEGNWFSAGYSLLRYEKGKFLSVASFSREPDVKVLRPLDVDSLLTYGISSSYDFTQNFSAIGSFFYQDYKHRRRSRNDWKGVLNYRLPFFKQLELGYEAERLIRPNVTIHSGTARFTDKFFKDSLLMEFLYRLNSENHSENFGVTNKNILELFASFPLKDWIILNADTTYQFNRGSDPEKFWSFRNYVTFILDWDAIRGRYPPIK